MKSKEFFHGLVFDEDAMGNLHIFARHAIRTAAPTPLLLQLSYPIGAELSQHLSHTTGLVSLPAKRRYACIACRMASRTWSQPVKQPSGFPHFHAHD